MFRRRLAAVCILSMALGAAGGGRASAQNAETPIMLGLGDSIGEGVQSADATFRTQPSSYLSLIARRLGAPFPLPWIVGGPLSSVGDTTTRYRAFPSSAGYNLAVSGATVGSLLEDRADALTEEAIDSETDLVLFPRLGSQIEIAESLRPRLMVCWIGNNDVLSTALSFDRLDASQMTSVAAFAARFAEIADRLDALDIPVVFANVPDVTHIGFLVDRQDLIRFAGSDFGLPEDSLTSMVALLLIRLGLADAALLQDPAFVLDAGEIASIRQRTDQFNNIIRDEAARFGMPVVDVRGIFASIAARPLVVAGVTLTPRFLGGLFSLDGVHPSNFGHALLANAFIARMNSHFGTHIPPLSNNELFDVFLNDPFIDMDGDGVVRGRQFAGNLETLGPILGISGDSDDALPGAAAPAIGFEPEAGLETQAGAEPGRLRGPGAAEEDERRAALSREQVIQVFKTALARIGGSR